MWWREFVPELLGPSQLIIFGLDLGRLKQATDLGSSFMVRGELVASLLFLLNNVELGIVASEFFERDQEIAQSQSELIVLVVQCDKALNESIDLGTSGVVRRILLT
jgi:hypothetical protein